MRRPRLDLRLKIAAALASVCIAVVGALGITLYLASVELEEALIEQLVAEEMEALIKTARLPGAQLPASGPNLQYYVISSPEHYEALPAALQRLGPGHHGIGQRTQEKRVAVRDVGGTRYIVAYDESQHEAREARYRGLVYLSVATAALIAVILGYWLAGVLTRELTSLAARVATLAPDEPHPPLERADHDRELAALAHALDAYHARVLAMMAREQEFTANASHELRTPLTAIRTTCELLAAGPQFDEKTRTRIAMIDAAALQMTECIESLLYLAREYRNEAREAVDMRSCIEDAANPYRQEIARKGLAFDVEVRDDAPIELDRKALQLVLANLIRNAVRYTEHGYLRVSYAARRLRVADSGTGITAEQLPQLFERYYRGASHSDGLGLGLAIVRRVCDDLGWKIEVESEPGAGSAFTVVLGVAGSAPVL